VTSIQEQYTETVKQAQDAVLTAVDAWTKTVQDAVGQLPAVAPVLNPDQVIDQVFDFAQKLLAAQREFAKNLVHTSTQVAETIRQGAARTTEAPPEG
jgi:hypothetical protein